MRQQLLLERLNNFKQGILILIFTGLFILLFSITGHAAEDTLTFHVTPEFPESQVEDSNGYFDLNLEPGETETLSLKLQNSSSEPVKIQVTPHTAYTNVYGVVEYGKDAIEPDPTLTYSIDKLIKPSEVIELAGDEVKTVNLELTMPSETIEGYLVGGLRIAEVKDEKEQEDSKEGFSIDNEFAYVIGVVVSNSRDSVQGDLDLLDVFADQLNYRNVISATIQNFTPTFVNRLAVDATVQRVGEEEVLYEASEEQMQMAPNSHFNFPIPLEGERFKSGDYTLKLKATSGDDEWSWERNFTIEADEAKALNREDVTIDTSINWWMIGSISLLVILIGIIAYMIYQKRRSAKKKTQEGRGSS